MRKPLVGFVVLLFCLAFSCMTAHAASTTITLAGGSCNSCFNFVVSGTSVTMTMSPSSTSFVAVTSGPLPIPPITTFTLSETGPILLTSVGGGLYDVASGSGGFNIDLSGGGFTLDGVLSIQNLSLSGASGTIDTSVVGNFDINPSSSYCGLPSASCGPGVGYGKVFLTLSTNPIANGSHGGLSGGSIVLPAANIAITPEPSSMLLFGTGLLAFGAILRRRSLHA